MFLEPCFKALDDLIKIYSHLVHLVFADDSTNGGPRLSFVNGVWIDHALSFKPSFEEVVDTLYKAACHQVDFQNKPREVRKSANSWVKNKTSGLIKNILPPNSVRKTTKLIFANALYFKGKWKSEFSTSETKRLDFHLLNRSSVRVPFMTSEKRQFISTFDGFKVLKLPYKQRWKGKRGRYQDTKEKCSYSLCIFLPDAKDGLPALMEKAMTKSKFLNRHIPEQSVMVGEFWIPKFKFEYKIEASEALKSLGLVLPFDPESVGLKEIVDLSPLYAEKIFHKSCIEVDEEGTEAAAAGLSCGAVPLCHRMPKPEVKIDFVADHPFLFFIRENITGIVLFAGQVLDPSKT
ncbi:Serpin-ZX [Heracleum sosnowskyi]|uniref:Serpin-ZX n=1 Tax=Heracleum sosnowskyi TaxID=360622 RepID=A0AAD8J3R8_9APIA|nr:Serpin-ZX [Heracleum sosnowskyi]